MNERLREQLEGAIQVMVVGLMVVIAFVASHIQPWNFPTFRSSRWVMLFVLACLAGAYLLVTRPALRRLPGAGATATFVALGLLSTAWSPDPRLTFGRGVAFAVLIAVAVALALGASDRPRVAGQLLLAVLAGTTIIAAAGLVELWHAYDQAIVPATRGQGARYSGIGQNPNQVAMLIAITLPLALWTLREARGRVARAAAAVVLLLLGASLVASGSRGAILGAFAGCLVYTLAVTARRRVVAGAAVTAVFVVAVLATQLPETAATDPVLNTKFGSTPTLSRRDLNAKLPLESEFGYPGENGRSGKRTLTFSSGRTQAWETAVRQALERPVAGYGFGTEDRTFVDRSYLFVSSSVENSFVGVFLQLGAAGLALIIAALALPLLAWRGASAAPGTDRREIASACAGVVVAGVALAVPQSYLTSVGSPPTAPFWFAVFLLGAVAARPGD